MPDDNDEHDDIFQLPEPDYNAFYLEMGRCIASWSDVEQRLFVIFKFCCNTDDRRAAIFFDKTPSLESRITLTNETMEAVPEFVYKPGAHPHVLLRKWRLIKTDIDRLKPVRNALCHHPVFTIIDSKDLREIPIEVHVEVTPTQMSYLRNQRKGSYKIQDLQNHMKDVSKLRGDLAFFINDYVTYFRTHHEAKP